MPRQYTKNEMRYIKDAIEIDDLNGFDRIKNFNDAQMYLELFLKDIRTIQKYGAYSLPQIAQELCISERTLRRYMQAEYYTDIKISLLSGVYANLWASYLEKHPTPKAKRRINRAKYRERYQRQLIKVVKGS